MPETDTTPTDPGTTASVFQAEDRPLDDASVPAVAHHSLAPAHEGLPPTYRMRATAHYVESLASAPPGSREQMLDPREITCSEPRDAASLAPLTESIRAHGVLQPLLVQGHNGGYLLIDGVDRLHASIAAGLRRVPCVTYDVDHERARELAEAARVQAAVPDIAHTAPRTASDRLREEGSAEVARSLQTLALCADIVSSDASSLSRTVAADLIKAEAWRASCLLQAARAIRGDLRLASTLVPVRRMIDRVTRELVPEQRLRGFDLEPEIQIPDGSVVLGDETLLVAAVFGAILATLPLVEGTIGARFTLKTSTAGTGEMTIDLLQATVGAPEVWFARAFDPGWTERPGGSVAALAMLSVRAIAELHHGRATTAAAGRGTRVSMAIPVGLPARR